MVCSTRHSLIEYEPDREIAGCISDIGISFDIQDLQKPNPQQMQKVFEWFAELLMNTTRDVVAPAMRAAAEDLCGDDMERIFTADTRELMGFFVSLRRLLVEVNNRHSFAESRQPGVLTTVTTTVRSQGLYFPGSLQAHASTPGQDIQLHYQLHPLSRVADSSHRPTLQQRREDQS